MGKETTYDDLMTALDQYVYFGTQEEAAKYLGVTRYTIWNRIAVLEARVGKVLLRSEKRPICRTPFLNDNGRRLLREWIDGQAK